MHACMHDGKGVEQLCEEAERKNVGRKQMSVDVMMLNWVDGDAM